MFEGPQKATPNTKLRDLRNEKQWTQADLAEALEVTEMTVKGWEEGYVIPSPFYAKKLCAFFQVSPEELSMLSTESSKKDAHYEENFSELNVLPTYRSPRQDTLKYFGVLPRKRASLRVISLLSICGVLILLGILVVVLIPHLSGSTQHSALTPSPAGNELYHADWSRDFDHWGGDPDWHWTGAEGGMITTPPSAVNNLLVAPYHPTTTNYSIEAQIKRINYSGTGGQAYGLVVHLASGIGYICGVGIHYKPEHFFVGQLQTSTPATPYYQITDSAHTTAYLDSNWHTYRIVMRDGNMLCQVDGKQVLSTRLTANLPAGNVGIYVDNASLSVRRFIVQE